MTTTTTMYLLFFTGTVLSAFAARAHYVSRSRTRKNVYWCVLAVGLSCVLSPLAVGAFSWNGALQFVIHAALVLAAVYAVVVYNRHSRVASAGSARARAFEQQWSAIAMSFVVVSLLTVLGYIVAYPAF